MCAQWCPVFLESDRLGFATLTCCVTLGTSLCFRLTARLLVITAFILRALPSPAAFVGTRGEHTGAGALQSAKRLGGERVCGVLSPAAPSPEAREAFLAARRAASRIMLKKCLHAVYLTLSEADSEMGLFIVQVEILISHKFPTNCCSTLLFIESVRVVYGTEARLPCLLAVATVMQGSKALEERPDSEVLWKVLEQAGGVK